MPRAFDPRSMPTETLNELAIKLNEDIINLQRLYDVNFDKWCKIPYYAPDEETNAAQTACKNTRINITKAYNKRFKLRNELSAREREELRYLTTQ